MLDMEKDMQHNFYIVACSDNVVVEVETLLNMYNVVFELKDQTFTIAERLNAAVAKQLDTAFKVMGKDLLLYRMTISHEVVCSLQ